MADVELCERPGNTGLGTPGAAQATRVMLLGSGELGKEVVIELQRFGVEVIAVDRYANAPAMQVAHRSHVIDMRDPKALGDVIRSEAPHLVVPEIEAIATQTLVEMEGEGLTVVPTARAAALVSRVWRAPAPVETYTIDSLPTYAPEAMVTEPAPLPQMVTDIFPQAYDETIPMMDASADMMPAAPSGFVVASEPMAEPMAFESTMDAGSDPGLIDFRRRVEAKLMAAGRTCAMTHAEVFKLIDDL